jgi:hypothetical protein
MAQVWDAARQEITSLPGHAGSVTSAAFPSGRVATAFDDDTARVGFVTFVGFTCQ